MLIVGLIGHEKKIEAANLINSILDSSGKKVSIIDINMLDGLSTRVINANLLDLEKSNVNVLILIIDIKQISDKNIKKIKFDVMICSDISDEVIESNDRELIDDLKNFIFELDKNVTIIVNSDQAWTEEIEKNYLDKTITYGFNSNACISTSSVGDFLFEDNFICCVQRTFASKDGHIIIPQEYKLSFESTSNDTYNVLAAATFAIANGIELQH